LGDTGISFNEPESFLKKNHNSRREIPVFAQEQNRDDVPNKREKKGPGFYPRPSSWQTT
jgi:hypothetical protein